MSFLASLLSILPFDLISPSNQFQSISEQKRFERHTKLVQPFNSSNQNHNFFNSFTTFERTILSTPSSTIVQHISQRRPQWNATNVVKAFIKSAIRAHVETNCLTEIMFESALDQAAALDEEFERTGVIKGRLHGLPISLKDQIDVQGLDSSIGFSRYANQPAHRNADLVQHLINEGAIIFVKTNVPQTMLAFECSNPLFGTTQNPHKRGFTCGGSSGGEAALLASDGSCIGIGTDVGGSLRIPAHYSGCYSLKPCAGRIPQTGFRAANPGFNEISSVVGPIARCVDDLILAMEVMVDTPEALKRKLGLIPSQFRSDELLRYQSLGTPTADAEASPKKLRLGYFIDDKFIQASPPCQRAVLETVERLRSRGHECVPLNVDRIDVLQAVELFVALSSADGYHTLLSNVGPDPCEPAMFLTTLGPRLPSILRFIVVTFLRYGLGDTAIARLLNVSRIKPAKEMQEWRVRKKAYEGKVRKYLWEDEELDGVLCPTQAFPAVPIGSTWNKSVLAVSTLLWNVVDSTVGQIPITKVDLEKDQMNNNPREPSIPEKRLKESLYDLDRMEGLPVGIQVVGGSWEEEKVLGIMKVIEECWNDDEKLVQPGSFLKQVGLDGNRKSW
ncbi:amidase signature domain-containing protein [Melampsora americana]|nr:amidase signature domain-containing protein [Melampsora americana]